MELSREWVNFLVSTGRLRSAAGVSDPQTTLIDVKSIDTLLMNFDGVREQLQAKNLSLGLWLQAVIDGEVATFKLRPRFIYDIENIRLAHFAFRRDQIRQYLSENCADRKIEIERRRHLLSTFLLDIVRKNL